MGVYWLIGLIIWDIYRLIGLSIRSIYGLIRLSIMIIAIIWIALRILIVLLHIWIIKWYLRMLRIIRCHMLICSFSFQIICAFTIIYLTRIIIDLARSIFVLIYLLIRIMILKGGIRHILMITSIWIGKRRKWWCILAERIVVDLLINI